MIGPSASLAQAFSNVGHSYSHILTILYPTVVLALEPAWGMSYGELIPLMLVGQILFGAAALPAGWLGDRWSMVGMMVVFFIGSGLAAMLTGLARNPLEIALGLGLIGAFASIYHPVGMAWLVREAVNRGKVLGMNGIFGAVAQYVGGRLCDRYTMKHVYTLGFTVQVPLLFLAATLDGLLLVPVLVATVFFQVLAIPAENGLLAHFTPGKWRATAYGAKFVLALGVAATAIPAIGWIHDTTGGFAWLYWILGSLTAIVSVTSLLLPNDRAERASAPSAAAQAAE